MMRRAAAFSLIWMCFGSGCRNNVGGADARALEHAVQQTAGYPDPTELAPDLYDMTDRWQAMFGVGGKLHITNGRMDARAAAADGDVALSFTAQPTQVGFYAFTFIHLVDYGRVDRAHSVCLCVRDDLKSAKPPMIQPEMQYARGRVYAAPGEQVAVGWSYNPGGEGIPGGWKLMKVLYSNLVCPPGVFGYEHAGGE